MKEVKAYPSKSFFVGMLTRDIEISDAVLDLLDNCLDGIIRDDATDLSSNKPYSGKYAHLTINDGYFNLEDNCGGIPIKIAKESAFRMGRPPERGDEDIPTIGMYGIGMKRAMFKMGQNIQVISKHAEEPAYRVSIDSNWLRSDEDWELDMSGAELPFNGTIINITDLHAGIQKIFHKDSDFIGDLSTMIATHYAYIIDKGLEIKINGVAIQSKIFSLLISKTPTSDSKSLMPYFYTETYDDVQVNIIIGLVSQAPSVSEDEDDAEARVHRRSDSGWTILCNDRVIVYGDKSRVTGWGDRGIPQFHYQFNTIVGLVEFKSNESYKLPVTTTKRGLDTSSDLYLRIKKQMLEGLTKYISYTNKWKNLRDLERETVITHTVPLRIDNIGNTIRHFHETTHIITKKDEYHGTYSKLDLPEPPKDKVDSKTIKYTKKIKDIELISTFITEGENPNLGQNEIGEYCFDKILEEAQKA